MKIWQQGLILIPWFRDEDMAAGFDTHPLKCTRNHFLKHDVTNVRLGGVVT
jgi:hypothetical protein